jgi:uncharacterized membrane protein
LTELPVHSIFTYLLALYCNKGGGKCLTYVGTEGRAEAQLVILVAAVAALIVLGIYVVDKVRRRYGHEAAGTSDLLTNFRQLHDQGELSDEEYRTIKTMLQDRLQKELNDNSEEA